MKAVVAPAAGPPESLEIRDLPIPEPGPGQARVKVAYSPLNPLDTHARAARIEWMAPGFPFTPGYEYSGLVDAVGDGVEESLLGQRVLSTAEWGGNAEYAVATAARLVPIPEGIDWQLGSVYQTTAFSSWHVLHTAGRLRPTDTVLIHSAAGPIGTTTTQIAKEHGATVIGLCGASKMDFTKQFGADHLIDSRAEDWVDQVKEATGGRGVDLIIDGVAGPHSARNYEAAAALGQVIYMGAMAGLPPPVDISRELYAKTIAVRGFVVYTAMAQTGGKETAAIHEALREGRWTIPITGVYELEDVPSLHAKFENRELHGKTLIKVGGDL